MSRKWEEQTATFPVTDANGEEQTLYVFTHFHEAWDGTQKIPVRGRKWVETQYGQHMNGIDGTTDQFFIVHNPENILTAEDSPDLKYGT
jgi:hypothetical protein